MRITFDNWHDARKAIDEIQVEGKPMMVLCQEGSVRRVPGSPSTWTSGTGRWFITDNISVPDRCALNKWTWEQK